jgi:hypothetical protein
MRNSHQSEATGIHVKILVCKSCNRKTANSTVLRHNFNLLRKDDFTCCSYILFMVTGNIYIYILNILIPFAFFQ